MATAAIGSTLSVAQLAATLSGVPFAAGGIMVLQMINAACSQVSVHKVNDLWGDDVSLLNLSSSLLLFLSSPTAKVCTTGSAVHDTA